MIQPKDVSVTIGYTEAEDPAQRLPIERTYVISKFPSVEGREIISKYPTSNMPKIGSYDVSEETMLKLMKYVGCYDEEGKVIALTHKALVNKHVPNWEALAYLEWSTLEYNCSFFQNGRISNFLGDIVQSIPQWISKILTDFLARSSEQSKLPSTN